MASAGKSDEGFNVIALNKVWLPGGNAWMLFVIRR